MVAREKSKSSIGKRKKAIARAYVKAGSGRILINGRPPESIWTRYQVLRAREPFIISGSPQDINIFVDVKGGGAWGQVDACRTAIGNALVYHLKNKTLKAKMLEYDRTLLISDSRRTEAHKPSRSSAGPRRTKQQSKR